MIVVDDSLPFQLVSGKADSALVTLANSGVLTTTPWYFRLLRWIEYGDGKGRFSEAFLGLSAQQRNETLRHLRRLPDWVRLADPRHHIVAMVDCATTTAANFLTLDAVAAGFVYQADVWVSVPSNLLTRCAEPLGVSVHVTS